MNPFLKKQRPPCYSPIGQWPMAIILVIVSCLPAFPAVSAQAAERAERFVAGPQEVIDTKLITVDLDGNYGYSSHFPSISGDGRYVAFSSNNNRFVPEDSNDAVDVFVYDNETEEMELISMGQDDIPALGDSDSPVISADGRYVAFRSTASNLVPGDTNEAVDVFVYDRQTKQTERVSVASDGTEANAASLDFDPVSAERRAPALSADGRYVAFWSEASNLVEGDTNKVSDVFVYDRQTKQTERVSVASDGTQADKFSAYPALSADGRYVAFVSSSTNLSEKETNGTNIYVHDRTTGQTTLVSVASDGTPGNRDSLEVAISADGRFVAFSSLASNLDANDTNERLDLFVHDRQTGQTERSVAGAHLIPGSFSALYFPAFSADGRYLVFQSIAPLAGLEFDVSPDIYLLNRETKAIELVSDVLGISDSAVLAPAVSEHGRYIAFMVRNLIWLVETDAVVPVPPAELSLNHTTGAPGSFFTITGSGFAASSRATISINGRTLDTLTTDAEGNLTFEIDTANAAAGRYVVRVEANTTATIAFTLDPAAATHPQEESGSLLELPADLAPFRSTHLPLVVR